MSCYSRPTALTIAGSDSGGGAGIQADLKTFAAHGVFGLTAVTAVTAQDSSGVRASHAVPAVMVAQQIEVVVADFGVGAAKTGMLVSHEIIEAVAACVDTLAIRNLVVDPLIVATSGDRLLAEDALEVLKTALLPRAVVTTPNRPEAERLTGRTIASLGDARDAARQIHDMGAAAVVITGGHGSGGEAIDLLYDGSDYVELSAPRIDVKAGHGTGCTFSAAVTAHLASGRSLVDATREAKSYVGRCLRHALEIGRGPGPLDHFCRE